MQTLNLNETMSDRPILTKRKDKRKMKRKEKFFNFLSFVKRLFCGVGSVYIILALVCYILISQIKLNNALTSMQRDTHIPRYVIDKIVNYLK